LAVKERPLVRVRDLPIAGRPTYLLWRKRRFGCQACGRTFTETHPQLPARQRVSARFWARLFERCRERAAHAEVARDEHTTRYQVARAFADGGNVLLAMREPRAPWPLSLDEAAHRRGYELATVVSDLDCCRVLDVLDGRSRRTSSAGCANSPSPIGARSRSSRSTRTRPTGKPSGLSCRLGAEPHGDPLLRAPFWLVDGRLR
jgi:transposase